MGLEKFSGPWWSLLSDVSKGNKIEKLDIVAALDSPYSVPDEAKPLIREVIEGNYKFKPGNKNNGISELLAKSKTMRYRVFKNVYDFKEYILKGEFPDEFGEESRALFCELNKQACEAARPAREAQKLAVKYTALIYGISEKKVTSTCREFK